MDKNIRIARELVKLAKSLVTANIDYEKHYNPIGLNAKYLGWIRCLTNKGSNNPYCYRIDYDVFYDGQEEGDPEPDLNELASVLNKLGYGNIATVHNNKIIEIGDPVCQQLEAQGTLMK